MGYVIPILILVAFSALFSSTETAFACVNKIRLKHMADSGDKRAEKALDIANRYEQALTAILVGNNVVNINAYSPSGRDLTKTIRDYCMEDLDDYILGLTPTVDYLSLIHI